MANILILILYGSSNNMHAYISVGNPYHRHTDHTEEVVRKRRLDHVQQLQDLGAEYHPRVPDINGGEDPLKLGQLGV